MSDDSRPDWTIRTEAELRQLMGEPEGLARRKSIAFLDPHCRHFIQLSPFLCIATCSADGRADVSPRGDQPGFVQLLDDRTLAIPDRPGNNRFDTVTNIMSNPAVGLIFFIPGFEDTLRINGKGAITRDPAILERATVNGKAPKLAIAVKVEKAFLHCAKAFRRSRLWDPAALVDRKRMPSLARMIIEQVAAAGERPDEATLARIDEALEEDYRCNLY